LVPRIYEGRKPAKRATSVLCKVSGACAALVSLTGGLLLGTGWPAAAEGQGGYWVVRADGAVTAFGAPSFGDLSDVKLPSPIAGGAAVPGGGGYWLVAANGGVYTFGDARFFGSPGGRHLNRPIVGMAATPDGRGYWLVASDGGIFAYGDAAFYGSTGHIRLAKKIVGMAASPDGRGYWLVASDGGIFAFGDAGFFGSAGGRHLNRPIVGMAPTPDGRGYWLVAADGGTFAYGDAGFFGSAGSMHLSAPIVAIAPAPAGRGYWLASASGGVFGFEDRAGHKVQNVEQVTSAKAGPQSKVVAILAAQAPVTGTSTPVTTSAAGPPTSSSPATTVAPVPTTAPTTTLPSTTLPPTTVPPTTTAPVTTTVPPPPYTTPYPPAATGYDVSWPQCSPIGSSRVGALPPDPAFAVVGVNGGTISSFNPCFAAEAAWAGSAMSAYIIVQPAPPTSPPQEMTGPKAACARTSSVCEGYDWGWNYAEADLAFVRAHGVVPKVWWVDVETGEGWPTAASLQPVNAAIVQGAIDAIRSAGGTVGIYSTWYQWGKITGSYMPSGQPPIWVPGASTLSGGARSAVAYCLRALAPGDPSSLLSTYIGFAGGEPWLVQFGYGAGTSGSPPTNIDPDYSCA